ncbi:hypothetical protein AMS68_004215 [Peltaster fructicola]|uniref:Uncharacterized protein n=1 Tax=Peltaster fructicola TaxID=286661 RepID=A0A6H0XVR2_9PEZI|nr:hypothetical protein AMS68_004215 [Peltaster fructicola]
MSATNLLHSSLQPHQSSLEVGVAGDNKSSKPPDIKSEQTSQSQLDDVSSWDVTASILLAAKFTPINAPGTHFHDEDDATTDAVLPVDLTPVNDDNDTNEDASLGAEAIPTKAMAKASWTSTAVADDYEQAAPVVDDFATDELSKNETTPVFVFRQDILKAATMASPLKKSHRSVVGKAPGTIISVNGKRKRDAEGPNIHLGENESEVELSSPERQGFRRGPANEAECHIQVRCKCGGTREDPAPKYCLFGGAYVVRQLSCKKCGKNAQHHPVNPTIEWRGRCAIPKSQKQYEDSKKKSAAIRASYAARKQAALLTVDSGQGRNGTPLELDHTGDLME